MYLGIDLGTSGVKALLMDDGANVVASATAPLTVSRPRPGWSEQAPADWIEATRAALVQLRAGHDLSAVRGIGLSGQMHGAVTLDAGDQVIRPAILWNDGRSAAQAARLVAPVQAMLPGIRVEVVACASQIGSGAMPVEALPSAGLALSGDRGSVPEDLAARLRALPVPVIGRIRDGALILDLRCLDRDDDLLRALSA